MTDEKKQALKQQAGKIDAQSQIEKLLALKQKRQK
jgi:hypothetical protein